MQSLAWVYVPADTNRCMGENLVTEGMPYDERDGETGQFEATFSEQEVIDAVERAEEGTTSEIAEIVGCAYRTAYEYLTRLESDEKVSRRKIGTTSVWTLTEERG